MLDEARYGATAEQEEIDGVHSECVYDIVPMQDTDELHRRLAQDQSVHSTRKVLRSIMMSVSLSNKVTEHISRNNAEIHLHLTSAEDCQKHEPFDKNMDGTQDALHIGQLCCANRICGESGNLQGNKHSAALFTIQITVRE